MPPKQYSPFKTQVNKLNKNKNYVNELNSTELENLLYYISRNKDGSDAVSVLMSNINNFINLTKLELNFK